jgi:hypothetical protein
MDEFPDALERLTARLDTLERRVEALEHASVAPLSATAAPEPAAAPASEAGEGLSLARAGGAFPVLGKAMLGICGAYVLRYVAQSSSLPRLAIAAVAIVYALLWLVGAARVKAGAWFSSAIYAGTSALILAPMLWELTLSFKLMPAPVTACVLCVFVAAATTLAWKQNLIPVFWVANATATAAAFVLSIATHELTPFIATLLLMALLSEYAAGRNHQISVRPLAAAAADAAIWAQIFIYSGPESTRTNYPAIGTVGLLLPGCLLFLIYAVSIGLRTTLRSQRITVFETGQAMIAFLLAASSVLYFAPGKGAVLLGAACLVFSATCYAAAFAVFRKAAAGRNFHVFAAWAAGLLLTGSVLCLPPFWLAACLGLAAIAATVSSDRLTLRFHGLVFLLAAAIASGLLGFAFDALAGTLPASLAPGVCMVSACALVCYAAGKHRPQESWRQQVLHLATSALAVGALAALLVEGLLRLVALRITPEAHHIAFIRTLILCAAVLALALAGSHWRRVELTRMAYVTLGLVAVKLLFEDMRLGRLEVIAASIFLFAITLIAAPRLAHIGKKA